MQLEAQPLYTVKLKGESEAAPDWYVPYHGQKAARRSAAGADPEMAG